MNELKSYQVVCPTGVYYMQTKVEKIVGRVSCIFLVLFLIGITIWRIKGGDKE